MNSKSKKIIVFSLVLFVVLGLALALLGSPPTEWVRAQRLGTAIQSLGFVGVLVFMFVCALATSVGLPRQLFAFAAGFAFGVFKGVLLSSCGAIAGCAITFICSRYWLRERVQRRYPKAIDGLNQLLEKDVFLKIIVLRIQPFGTNLITNLSAGVTHIPAKQFLLSSWIGYLPQMLVFSLLGSGIRIGSGAYMSYSLSLFLLSLGIGFWLYRRTVAAKSESN